MKKLEDDQKSITEKFKFSKNPVEIGFSEVIKAKESTCENAKCKVCDVLFEDTNTLKAHTNNDHPKVNKCKDCNIEFQKINDLEEQIVDENQARKKYKSESVI